MANIKITDLVALTDPASTDVLPIVDIGADATKKISIADLLENAGSGTAALPGIAFDGDPNTGIYRPGDDQLAISTNGAGRLFIDASGRSTFDSGANAFPLAVNSTNPYGTIVSFKDSGVSFAGIGGAGTLVSGANKNDTAINYNATNASRNLIFASSGTERLRITSDGKLGLGTSSPSNTLHVIGTGRFNVSGANNAVIASDSGDPFLYTEQAAGLKFGTNSAVRMTIDSSGNVGIGTTSPGTSLEIARTSGEFLRINTTTTTGGYMSFRTNNANIGFLGAADQLSSGSSSDLNIRSESNLSFSSNGAIERARIDSSGRLLVGTSSARTRFGTIQVEGTSYNSISCVNNTNDTGSSSLVFGKSRGTATGSNTIVQSGDVLGSVIFQGADGTDMATRAAAIFGIVDGTPGVDDMPGRLVFSVTADGASSLTEAMRIKNSRIINIANTPVYADNAAAKTGGLVDGDVYRTSTGDLKIVYT